MSHRFHTLGQFCLFINGRPVTKSEWGTHRAATICKLLLSHRQQRVHKEQIHDWVWPNATAEAAARNLRVALSELRRILEPDRQPRETSRFIENGGDTLRLNCEEFWIDSEVLAQASRVNPRSWNALRLLDVATELYQGVYLPDDLYADWAQIERDRLALAYETALQKLADAYALRDRYDDTILTCRRALTTHPTSEVFAERLMRSAWHIGNTQQALQAYEDLRVALQAELDVCPSRHLTELAAQIRGGETAEIILSRLAAPVRHHDFRIDISEWKQQLTAMELEVSRTMEKSNTLLTSLADALNRVRTSRAHLNSQAAQIRNRYPSSPTT